MGGVVLLEGCSVSSVFTDLLNWIPVGEAALNGIVTLLQGAGVIPPGVSAIVTTIEAAFAQLEADVKLYQSINPPPAGALAKVEAAIEILIQNFQTFLQSINVSDSVLLTTIVGLVQIIMSTIAAFQAQMPASTLGVKTHLLGASFRVGANSYTFAPKHRTRRAFKKDWNKVATAGGHPEIEMKLTLLEHL
jgi:hypothetical protein